MLLQLPTVSGSIEVWDFLSVDSQVNIFISLSLIVYLSIINTKNVFDCLSILSLSFLRTITYTLMQTYAFSNPFSIVETLSGEPFSVVNVAFTKFLPVFF